MDITPETPSQPPLRRPVLWACVLVGLLSAGCSTEVDYGVSADQGEHFEQTPPAQEAPLFEQDAPPITAGDLLGSDDKETATPETSTPPATPVKQVEKQADTVPEPEAESRFPAVNAEVETPADRDENSEQTTSALPPELLNDPLIVGGLLSGLIDQPPADEEKSAASEPETKVGEDEVVASVAAAEPAGEQDAPVATFVADDEGSQELEGSEESPAFSFLTESPTTPVEEEPAALASPVDEPALPARPEVQPIQLDAKNTRHLAWLLGAKATVVTLAQIAGVEEAKESQWEIEMLAELLSVPQPGDGESLAKSESTKVAVIQLIRQARSTVEALGRRHGDDHAALMEIALKTNALLVLYESEPALAAPVRRAVEAAETRARLPDGVLTPLLSVLDGATPADDVQQAVHGVHRTIERLLREGG